MTKAQKAMFKELSSNKGRRAFVDLVQCQQMALGKYAGWAAAYAKKCVKKGVAPPN